MSGQTETTKVKTEPKPVKITWGYCSINPITQVIEHFYKERKKNG
jgi:hypothetical protein